MNAFLSALWDRITNEPVLVTTLVASLLDAAIAFGAPLTVEQKTAVIGLVTALAAVFARSKVTPV